MLSSLKEWLLDTAHVLAENLVRRAWWIEVFMPLVLASTFFVPICYVLYSGNVMVRHASRAEDWLLITSKKLAGVREAEPAPGIVSLIQDTPFPKSLPQNTDDRNNLSDPMTQVLDAKERLLEELAKQEPARIWMEWPAPLSKQLLDKVTELGLENSVTFLLNRFDYRKTVAMHLELARVPLLTNYDTCDMDLQIACDYTDRFPQWAQFQIAQTFGAFDPASEKFLSRNLPRYFSAFVLNLAPASVTEFELTEKGSASNQQQNFDNSIGTLKSTATLFDLPDVRGKQVFVSSKVEQSTRMGLDRPVVISGFLTEKAVPIASYLAALAEMFQSRSYVYVGSLFWSWAAAILLTFTWILLSFYYPSASVSGLLIFPVLALGGNAICLRYFSCYLPSFPLLLTALGTGYYSMFLKISISIVRGRQLMATHKALTETSVLKGNFLALVSHNLNTQIAKIKGMLDILGRKYPIQDASRIGARMQIQVRSVLSLLALEERNLRIEQKSLQEWVRILTAELGPIWKQLGMNVDLRLDPENEDSSLIPFGLEKRSLATWLAAKVYTNYYQESPTETEPAQIDFAYDETSNSLSIRFEGFSDKSWQPGLDDPELEQEKKLERAQLAQFIAGFEGLFRKQLRKEVLQDEDSNTQDTPIIVLSPLRAKTPSRT